MLCALEAFISSLADAPAAATAGFGARVASQAAAAVRGVLLLLLALLRQTAERLGQLLRAAAGMEVDISKAAAVPAGTAAGV